jgi:2-oxoglutarate ferredoxin oxidoreductase subunit beta
LSLIEVLQPCPTYNKLNTFAWYSQRVYKLNDDPKYDQTDKAAALAKAAEWGEHIPLGIIYNVARPSYEDKSNLERLSPLVDLPVEDIDVTPLLNDFT